LLAVAKSPSPGRSCQGSKNSPRPAFISLVKAPLIWHNGAYLKWKFSGETEMKRLKRKQLKSDEFVTTFGKVVSFMKKWQREFKIGGVALFFAICAFLCVQFIQSKNIKKQNILLGNIFQLSSEINESPEKITELENLSGKGKYSRIGFLKLGVYWFEQGDFKKALDQLNKISAKKKDLVYYQSRDLMGQILVKQKNYDGAI